MSQYAREPGECPHPPEKRTGLDEHERLFFAGMHRLGCADCGLRGKRKETRREAAQSFLAAVKRERQKSLAGLERLIRQAPEGTRVLGGRRL